MKKTFKKLIAVILTAVICLSIMPFASAAIYGDHVIIRGDADEDGKVNSSDALLVLQYAVGKVDEEEINWQWADLNGDDEINSSDALRILQIAVGSDNPLKYSEEEIVKFYADALTMSCQNPSQISYYSYYGSLMENDADPDEYYEFDDNSEYVEYFVDGYDEYGYSTFDFCPAPWLLMDFVSSAEIEMYEDEYCVTITLNEEWSSFEEPAPANTYWYTANYADCTVSGVEGLTVYDASACFYEVQLTAFIGKDGFVNTLFVDIPFTMYMSVEDDYGYYYADFTETGIISDSYFFYF